MAKLEEYRRKRHFDRTPEPRPAIPAEQASGTFVVQKHAATRLHYDFRLAIDGVLKSWAVPKGPSQNPADKRLAVQTEDHPLDYENFEGNIPTGNYGAGAVMVWDRGTFAAEDELDPSRQVARGEIKFSLQGEKLSGSYVLVKLKHSEKGNEWLMIKHADQAVDSAWNIDEQMARCCRAERCGKFRRSCPRSGLSAAPSPATSRALTRRQCRRKFRLCSPRRSSNRFPIRIGCLRSSGTERERWRGLKMAESSCVRGPAIT